MSEQQDALEDLGSSGVLSALAWANTSAYRRTMEDYDPDTGHDQGWVGGTAHRLYCDRLHRVFSTGKHAVDSPEAASAGLDAVAAGLFPGEYRKMPIIAPGVVTWSDLNQSPGWRCGRWRLLLASFVYGESNRIPWPQKSPTKRLVASQAKPDGWVDPHPMLPFEDESHPSPAAVLQAVSEEDEDSELTTLIVAHSVELELGIRELYLGRSRLNRGGGEAWYWKHDLLATDFGTPGTGPIPASPGPRPAPSGVQDAPVRLRRQAGETNDKHQAGKGNDKQ
ncbi:hypothetical protein P1P68_20730 [Streptomyces scabiei]|uniref:hypothetical protein n=1 Tax=Streptomyces scabiei TaxID=1930 RepID=UPI00298FEC28|nr:hypothetical protein [Streptomyces scabiei]MDW8807145.1 hypothetical protein [Streptomyces scabiei]